MLRLRKTLTTAGLIAIALGARATVEAATVEAMTLDEMARRAEIIFIGRCLGSRADWNAGGTRVYTYVSFEVERYLKGGAGERELTVRLWGGRVGEMMAVVPGTPRFSPGEEVLVFCAGSRARVPTVLGLSLGKFSLTRDGAGDRILKRDISGLILAKHRTDSRQPGDPLTRYRLSEVVARIESAVNN